MATFATCFQKQLSGLNWKFLRPFLQSEAIVVNNVRSNHMFKYLSRKKEHKEEHKYEYEESSDPKEWEAVERLMPFETVPEPKEKPTYPSGWRAPREEALEHPYYVERSKNHMLPVYLKVYNHTGKLTKVKNIHGDLWMLHDELKEHLERERGRKIGSSVNEGSNLIQFRGDVVYFCEQFLLAKGF